MKDIRYNISLYIIIPVIFSGVALLAMLLSYNITGYYLRKGLDPEWPMTIWGLLLVVLTYIVGLLIARMLLNSPR